MKISKNFLLKEKPSGSYSCPQFIDPKFGKAIIDNYSLNTTDDATKLFTEIMENFGMSMLKDYKGELTRKNLINLLSSVELED